MLVTATAPVPARAQEAGTAGAADATPPAPARLELTALAPVVGALADLDEVAWAATVTNTTDGGGDGVTWSRVDVTAELRGPVTTRSALRAVLAGADVTPLLRRRSVALDPRALDPGEVGRASGAVPLRGLAPAGEPGGVHPLRLRVIADGTEVARLDTAVVRLGTAPAETLATALVWPLTHPPLLPTGADTDDAGADDAGTDADGTDDVGARTAEGTRGALAAAIAPDGRLGAAVAAIAGADPAVAAAVTLAPAAHLLEDLAVLAAADDDAAGDAGRLLATLRVLAATGRSGPVPTPYGGADLARLTAADPDGAAAARAAAAAAYEGRRRLLPLSGRAAAPVTLFGRPTSPRALDLVDGAVLLPHAALDLPDPDLDPTLGDPVRRVTAASGRIVPAAVADPFLAEALAGTDRAVVAARQGGALAAAQEVLVRSALVFLQAPGRGDRGLLLVAPDDLDVDPAAAAALLARLGAAPWLALVGPATLVARAGTAAAPRATLVAPAAAPAPRLAAGLTAADAALRRALVTVVPPEAGAGPLRFGGRTPAELQDVLLRAAAAASVGATPAAGTAPTPADDPPSAAADLALTAIADVRAAAEGALGPVAVAAADLTLTDRRGPLPLGVANGGALPLRVTVEVTGPAGLAWPEGRTRPAVLPAGGDVALEIPVAARGTGASPVLVRVLDATGGELASARLTVRATAVAGPALVGIAAAIVVMTAVGLVRQRRRGRRRAA